jgi:NADH-quinone oxidoreductase subunit G
MSATTAAESGLTAGAKVSVSTSRGSISVPVEITAMPDRVVWLPTNSAGCSVRRDLAAGHGSVVTVSAEGSARSTAKLSGGDYPPNPPAGRSAE